MKSRHKEGFWLSSCPRCTLISFISLSCGWSNLQITSNLHELILHVVLESYLIRGESDGSDGWEFDKFVDPCVVDMDQYKSS